jgi:chorismate lyase/3-hydroxybenzoate synthase
MQFKNRMLGAAAFGAERPLAVSPDCPYAWVHMPVLEGAAVFETWTSEQEVVREKTREIASARDADVLFGCLQSDADQDPERATRTAYNQLFDFIDSRGYKHLLRVWNYVPHINAGAGSLDRYRRFCVGRHEAFTANGRVIGDDAPAACALGTRAGPLIIYFIAAKKAGQRVENPRQVSAYRYPPQYGPRSPTFSRAMWARSVKEPMLFISGTASVVGHETLHAGNAAEQARETVVNLLAVMGEARVGMPTSAAQEPDLQLKAYVRDPQYLAAIRDRLAQTFGSRANVVYLHADICRSDLLLEVEGLHVGGTV